VIIFATVLLAQSGGGSPDSTSWLDYAPVAIAAVALLSLLLGLSNRKMVRRSLELSEAQEARREPRLTLHLNESVSWRRPSEGERLLGFHLLASNPTDRPSSLVRAELHLTYAIHGTVTTVKVPHASGREEVSLPRGVVPIQLPSHVGANDAVSGWFLFRVAEGVTDGRAIDRYDVVLRDVHGVIETLQVTLFREVPDDEAT
jgi:hypothetical protein